MPRLVASLCLLAGLAWVAISGRLAWMEFAYLVIAAATLYAGLRRWERQQLRAAAREAQQAAEWHSIFESAPVPMWLACASGRIVAANTALADALGFHSRELIGRPATDLLDPADVSRAYAAATLGERAPVGIFRYRTAAGGHIVASTHTSALVREGALCNLVALENVTELRAAERLLAEREATFHELLGAMTETVWIGDVADYRTLYCSPAVERITGWTAAELLDGRVSWAQMVHPEDLAGVIPRLDALVVDTPASSEVRVVRKDGRVIWIESSSVRVSGTGGASDRIVSLVSDVTVRRGANEDARLAQVVFQRAREGIVVTDGDLRILRANAAFVALTGEVPVTAPDGEPRFLCAKLADPDIMAQLRSSLAATGAWRGDIWCRTVGGDPFLASLSITSAPGESGAPSRFVGVMSDVTASRRDALRIERLSRFDAVTGLPNRQAFEQRVTEACTGADNGGAVIAVGLDRFKAINDTLGHQAGDAFLAEIAERIRTVLSAGETVARLQSDIFAVWVPLAASPAGAAERILAAVAVPFEVGSASIHLTASAGLAVYPEDGVSAADLARHAETAMFHAKSLGRDRAVRFTPQLEQAVSERLSLESRLRRALQRGEFVLHYQPQVSLRSGALTGVEALVRWEDPELGLLPPANFIPALEEAGLILLLGGWVLREACATASAWHQAGEPVLVAVNISALQFRQPDFVEGVAAALVECGLPPHLLELEVTEGVVMDGASGVRATLVRLRTLGVRLSIDDFGTGYSSLAYLRRFPIDKLKIDQSFVRDMLCDADAAVIVGAIVQLGKALRLEVIAEGVEDEAQAALLAKIGCDEAQGWLYAKAMPATEFEAWRHLYAARVGVQAG